MLLPTADPRNMKLRGEGVIDILESGIPEVDPISFVEEHYGTSTGGTSSISMQGSINQAEGAAADTHKDHDQSEAISGEDLEQNSASYRSVSSNMVNEMEKLCPFLHDVDLEATDQNGIPDDQPVKESQSGKQCIPNSPQLQKLEYEGEVKLRHSRDDPRKRKRRSVRVIDMNQSSLEISTSQITQKTTQTDEDSTRPVSYKSSIHGFNRESTTVEDLRQVSSQKVKEDASCEDVGENDGNADSISLTSVTSNLVEEMENLYPFLRDVTLFSADIDNLSVIMAEFRNGRSERQGTLPNPGQERYSTNSLLEGPLSFEEMFSQPYCCLRMVLQERFPLAKLRLLVMCLQALTESVKEQVSRKMGVDDYQVGGDDLVPCLIFFLIKGDPGQVTALYPQLRFLEDYLPDAVAGGIIGFSLTQFLVAFSSIIQMDGADTST
ncbi:uncharacterized protein LOC135155692 [Lytechinus pictus]|uniref:uncharacterized protein LOC135155692 n=1 Tax=Lytechinus pictus TaxID=7653 RepID=UPI0030BA122C